MEVRAGSKISNCTWNAGKLVGAKRALKPQQVWAIRFLLDREKRVRDRALFDFAIDSKLRGYALRSLARIVLRSSMTICSTADVGQWRNAQRRKAGDARFSSAEQRSRPTR